MYKYVLIALLGSILVFLGSRLELRIETLGARNRAFGQGRVVAVISYALSAFLFCMVAGLRSYSVGSDVEVYVIPSFDVALSSSFDFYFMEGRYAGWMPLSKIIFWAIPNLTHSMFWMLFIIQVIVVAPLFVALRILLKGRAWLGVLIFGLVFFPISLNNMRQFMGMGFLILSYLFVRRRKLIPFVAFIVVAALFHETCLLGLLVYPIWLIASGELKAIKVQPVILAIIALASVQIFFPALQLAVPYLGRFGLYLNRAIETTQSYNGITELRFIVFMCVAFGLLYCWFTRKEQASLSVKGEASGLAAVVFFGVALFSLCLYSYQLFRLGVFFLYYAVLLIPLLCEKIVDRRARAEFAIVIVCFFALFGQAYFGAGAHEVIPYTIELSGKF